MVFFVQHKKGILMQQGDYIHQTWYFSLFIALFQVRLHMFALLEHFEHSYNL